MKTVKIFVRPDNTTTIICPACNTAKNISVAAYKNKKHSLKVKCPCQEVFTIQLDFRHHYRKETNLPATMVILDKPEDGNIPVRIQNISLSGIGLLFKESNLLHVGQELLVDFTLDDKKKTQLKKKVVVVAITGELVGCRIAANQPFEKALGFFMQQ